MKPKRIIIMGAAGRDFHNFNCCFRNNPAYNVVAFTATQIPFISNRRYPASLAGKLYPRGIPVHPEEMLTELIHRHHVDEVVFAYSDISHRDLMHVASRVLAAGADFRLIGPDATMLKSSRPVVSVSAVRTGCGKSQVVGYFCDIMREKGIQPVVVRHPMPYGKLEDQEVERFAEPADLDRYHCTIEEREEYEHLIERGAIVFAGTDYGKILRRAEDEGKFIIWDGGNNDMPFFRPDLEIVVADPLRPGHETAYFPGEVNFRRAGLIVINKVNVAGSEALALMQETAAKVNPEAQVVLTDSIVAVTGGEQIKGKRVLVIEDGPTITHGNMPYGAGLAAARAYEAGEAIDPKPWATGSLAETFRRYPHIGPVLPAMGYTAEQCKDLENTIAAVPCDLVLSASPIDLTRIVTINKPLLRVTYEIGENGDKPLRRAFIRFIEGAE